MTARIDVNTADAIVSGSGEIDLSSADALRAAIDTALRSDASRTVVIDLRDVTFIDSTGLNELIRPRIAGHSIVLRSPSDPVRRVLKVSGLYGAIDIETD